MLRIIARRIVRGDQIAAASRGLFISATGGDRDGTWENEATDEERRIAQKVVDGVGAAAVAVRDSSGGCGTMYEIMVESDSFEGKSIVKRQMMITKVLSDDIPNWHGFTMETDVPGKTSVSDIISELQKQ
ncbi:unnamed protein product [Pedinophyceae sp. YPF-701]|nr:unnamed protein product [Pedinophyceae sp. YPF-701]